MGVSVEEETGWEGGREMAFYLFRHLVEQSDSLSICVSPIKITLKLYSASLCKLWGVTAQLWFQVPHLENRLGLDSLWAVLDLAFEIPATLSLHAQP